MMSGVSLAFVFTFPPELKDTVEQVVKNELGIIEHDIKKRPTSRIVNFTFKRVFKLEPFVKKGYEVLNDEKIVVWVHTPVLYTALQNKIVKKILSKSPAFKQFKKYEELSEGLVKVDVVLPEECDHVPEKFPGDEFEFRCRKCYHPLDSKGKPIDKVWERLKKRRKELEKTVKKEIDEYKKKKSVKGA